MADDPTKDLDFLADFILEAVKTGKVDILKGMALGGPLKRQVGQMDRMVGHVIQRHCREDPKTSMLIDLAAQQSPAFAKLAAKWGLLVKPASEPEVKEAKPC
jgi:hypothetical protein